MVIAHHVIFKPLVSVQYADGIANCIAGAIE